MIHRQGQGLSLLHCGVQAAGGLALFVLLVLFFVASSSVGMVDLQHHIVYALLILGGFLVYTLRSNLWNQDLLHLDSFRCAQMTLRQLIHIAAPLFLFLVATKDLGMSRFFLFTYFGLLAGSLFLTNRRLPSLLAELCFRGRRQQKTLLCGMPEDLARIRPWVRRKTAFGMQVIGFTALKPIAETQPSLPTWESIDDLEAIIEREKINQVILTRALPPQELNLLSARCDSVGSRLFVVHDLEEQLGRPVRFVRDEGLNFVTLREEPLECPLNRLTKRALDICIAFPVVIFVLPWVSLLVWLAQRLQSPGPLFFPQRRTGLHNEHFPILKYRTMHVDHGQEALATESGPRIFALGQVMRKLSLDELPQFVNVLRGDMSVVGPRPHLFEHDQVFAKITETYRGRAFVKPGITGLAQVRGHHGETKTDESVRARVASDVHYLENWSPMLDLLIILRSAWQMIRPPAGAR